MDAPQQSTGLHKPRSSISMMLRKISPSVFSWMQTGANQPTSEIPVSHITVPTSTHMTTPNLFSSPNSPSSLSLNSHMPLLTGSNTGPSQDGETIPDTVNEMDTEAKARAVKKARKLSRVFGEIPAIASLAEDGGDGGKGAAVPPSNKRRASFGLFRMPSVPDFGVSRIVRPATTGARINQSTSDYDLPKLVSAATSRVKLELEVHAEESDEPPLLLTPRQARRISMAKLTRHLGENIPPELLAPTSSVGYQSPLNSPKPKSQTSKARKSLDAALLSRTNHERPDDLSNTNLKRSKSLWTRKKGQTAAGVLESDSAFQNRYNNTFGNEDEVRARCRALRVKRVKKVRQILGQEPPPEFIRAIASDPERIITLGDGYRDSVATIISLSQTYFRSTTPLVRSRSASIATVTSSETASGFMTAPEDEGRLSISELRRSHTPPLSKLASQETELPMQSRRTSMSSIRSFTMPTFRERRLRIAKLIHFFGVDYQNISDSMRPNIRPSSDQRREHPQTPEVEVDIKIAMPSRFWGLFERNQDRQANLGDVIGRLRDLRAG